MYHKPIKKQHKTTKKFRTKIFKIFIFISIVPLLIISSSSLYIVIKTRQQNIAELQNLAIENTQEKITKFLNEQMEGFNLVISGKSSQEITAPKKLTETDPDHLIFLIKKKKEKDNAGIVEKMSFIDQNGSIIVQIDRENLITLKKYYQKKTIITHKDLKTVDYIGDYDVHSPSFKTAMGGRDYIEPNRLIEGQTFIRLASQIKNQNRESIGIFLVEINSKQFFNRIYSQIKQIKPIILNSAAITLADIDPDILNQTIKDAQKTASIKIADNNQQLINLVEKITFIDKSNTVLMQIDKDNKITLNPLKEIKNLPIDIIIDPSINNYNFSNLNLQTVIGGQNYISPFKCAECISAQCAKCVNDKYVVRLAFQIKNQKEKIIGIYVIEINPLLINQYITTIIFGDATKNLTEVNPNNLIYFINSVKQISGHAKKIKFINKDGTVLGGIDESGLITIKNRYWEEYFSTEIVYKDIALLNRVDDNALEDDDFGAAIHGDDYFGPLEFIDKQPMMRLASQIENEDRERIGVISAEVDLGPIHKEIISNIQLGNTGFVYLVDDNGNVIACSNKKFAKVGDNLKDVPLVKSVIGGYIHDGVKKFETYTNPRGEDVVFAGRPMREPGQTDQVNWFVLSEWPKKDAFSVINDILKLTLLITLGTLLLIIVLGLIFTKQIVKPIKSLRSGAKHISQGDYDYRIRLKTGDEFEMLGNKFNEMIKVLKENQKLRDEFVFISAHELRTPVTAIKGYLSMILEETFGEVPPKIKENLDIINQSNERLVQLVQDLLEVARSEAGKMKVEMTPVSISEDVKTVINELKSLSDQKAIKIVYQERADDIKIKADSYKLKEVLINLIGNAIKYTLDKGSIEISHEIKDKYLITHIKDHGMGMSPENVKKLFSKFFRVQTKETADIEGTGLGLFICKEIIERMNGKIWVKSEVGQGSTFSFSLQLV